MRNAAAVFVAGVWITEVSGGAQSASPAFKRGTFQQGNRTFAGAVVNDSVVVDLPAADPTLPNDLKEIIAQYGTVKAKVAAAVSAATRANTAKPGYRFDLNTLKVLPPVMP